MNTLNTSPRWRVGRWVAPVGALLAALGAAWAFSIPKEPDPRIAPYRFAGSKPTEPGAEIAFLEKRVARDPNGGLDLASLARLYLAQARRTGDAGGFAKAEATARRSLANLTVNNEGAKLVLARLAEARHDFPEAVRLAREVLKARPGDSDAKGILVTSNLALGRLDEAEGDADEIIDRIPTLGAHALRALVMEARGRDLEALYDYSKAIAVEDVGEVEASAWVRTLLGRFHARRGRPDLAREYYEEALRIVPAYPQTLGLLAELEARAGAFDRAEAYYEAAWKRLPELSFLVDRAGVKASRGDVAGAASLYAKAEKLLRQDLATGAYGHRGELVHLLLNRGRPEDVPESVALAREEALQRRDAGTLGTLAWALSQARQWNDAREAARQALRTGIRDAELFHRAGTIEAAVKNPARAAFYFERALEADPTSGQARSSREKVLRGENLQP